MGVLFRKIASSLAVLTVVSAALAGCGHAGPPQGGRSVTPSRPATSSPAPASTSPASPAPSAAGQLAAFFAAAEQADSQLRDAAALVNADISATSIHFSAATIAALEALTASPAAAAIPLGMPSGLMQSVLLAYSDLVSRTAAFKGALRNDYPGGALPIGGPQAKQVLRCLGNGAHAAGQFPADLAAAQATAGQTPPLTPVAPDSRAAAESALRVASINLVNSCSDECGGHVFPELETIIWQPANVQHSDHYSGTISGIRFDLTYHPGPGWSVLIYAC